MSAVTGAPQTRLAGLVLAAGASHRLGHPKQLVYWGGQTLLARAVGHALHLCDAGVVVVTGAHAAEVKASLADMLHAGAALQLVHNPAWADGLGSSIACGMRALRASGADSPAGVLMLLCDQPVIGRAELVSLVNLWQTDTRTPVAARYNGQRGVPAVFPRTYFAALAGLTGEHGARGLLAAAEKVPELSIPGAAFDVDTPAALQALQQMPADDD
ncbi:MAG: nucleotidyltransferase family protein [Gammaproteobacteria bacterium]|jgi:molybdenum cofactor cytidylyltransferase|nr:nucleotidyltransferase family protein [Gammaproteobacteria bacterium]